MIDLFANSTACVLPEQLRYINITYQGQCMLFEVPIPTTGADLHSMLTAAFFPDAAGTTPALRLTDAESGHVISDGPEHVHTSSSHIIHCEVSRPDGQYEEPVNLRYRDMFLCFLVRVPVSGSVLHAHASTLVSSTVTSPRLCLIHEGSGRTVPNDVQFFH